MKSLLFLGLVALAWASSIRAPYSEIPQSQYYTEGDQYMHKSVLQLFQYINQPDYFPEYQTIGSTYSFEQNIKSYTNPKYVQEFFKHYQKGSLPKGEVFSIFYDKHQHEAIAFFRLLYSAVDFETFYNTAVWGRMNLNEGLYIYALSVALVHRPDTWHIQLPPIYEIYPYYFYNFNVFKTAYEKTGYHFGSYQYLMHGQQQFGSSYPSQYHQKSLKYPYYFGKYFQNQYQQYPYEYQSEHPAQRTYYGPLSQQYYEPQQYQQTPYWGQINQKYPYGPYSQQYYQQYGKQPWSLMTKYGSYYPQYQMLTSGQFSPYSQKYYEKYSQNPWVSMGMQLMSHPGYQGMQYGPMQYSQIPLHARYQQTFPTQYGKSMEYQHFGKYPYSLQYPQDTYRPYSQEYYEMAQKMPGYNIQQYPYFQKSLYKSTPFFEGHFQKFHSKPSYGSYEKPELHYGKYEGHEQQQSQVPIGEYYQQEREKTPMEYYQQGVTVEAKYTTHYAKYNPEYVMSYFTEDVGLNAFYYYYNIYFPFWMKNQEIIFSTQKRGEQFYYIYQQLLARYNLERISNGLGEVPLLHRTIPNGFKPDLVYPNGMPFPERPDNAPVRNRFDESPAYYDNDTLAFTHVKLYERRLLDAIDSGFVLSREGKYYSIFEPHGFEILGNMIQCNPESPNVRYYGSILVFARYLLGYSNYPLDQYHVAPSVLEQFETSLRDPAFYQLSKRIIYLFQRYKQYLPMYSQEELLWNGVIIQDVKVDKLTTYFDYFYSDISNVIQDHQSTEKTPVYIKQYRLNHQPFNYYLNVLSDKSYEAVVRVFLGPKHDAKGNPIDLNRDRMSFVELDTFHYTLVSGLNTIERNSKQFDGYIPDRTSYKDLFMQLVTLGKQVEETVSVEWGFPQRLLLPKGTKEGQIYQMYFMITPYQPVQKVTSKKHYSEKPHLPWDRTFDAMPYGYPFDKPIDESVFYVPNSYFHDVTIYNEFTPEYPGEYKEHWELLQFA